MKKAGKTIKKQPTQKTPKAIRTPFNTVVLAISPYTNGFGYAVFHSQQELIDWGVTNLYYNKYNTVLNRLDLLLNHYKPHAVTILKPNTTDTHKTLAMKITESLSKLCVLSTTPLLRLDREDVRNLFSTFGATTKESIATKLVEFLPELKIYKPPHRAVWEREHRNMQIFDAASLALTFYDQLEDIENLGHGDANRKKRIQQS